MRFAFYGCVDGSDPEGSEVSKAWQREMAEHTIAGQGVIVAGFFDVEVTSRASWAVRPRASALLAVSGESDRGFDAVVVGDFERAFGTVAEFEELVLFERCGVRVWMHEAVGLVSGAARTSGVVDRVAVSY
ncbi:hypothetical protein Q5530_06140 [Saccharothrix sp. BKS2]|uniref:hypothetical protein n=1 Tax=Saccharothrix sp. BKS2 TaxID=3064400 RepID=UPI0039E989B0